ncbi:MAG: cytidylate kinase family protein [Bacteroidota bacterium]
MKMYPKISLTGDLGSGKSHVSRLLSEKLGFEIISTGLIQREIAEKYGMTTLELNDYSRTHPKIDDEIDGKVVELSQTEQSLIFDSRLAWYFAPKSFKIYLTVDLDEAVRRIYHDKRKSEDYLNKTDAKMQIQARRQSEIERFRQYYNFSITLLTNYDLVIDTTHITPEAVCEKIIQAYDKWVKA